MVDTLARLRRNRHCVKYDVSFITCPQFLASKRPWSYRLVVDAADLEGTAQEILKAGGEDGSRFVPISTLAKQIFDDPACIRYVIRLPRLAMLTWEHGRPVILARRGAPIRSLTHAIAHELAHWALPSATESDCNWIGAALIAPLVLFNRDRFDVRTELVSAAKRYCTTESLIALRVGEVWQVPLVLITRDGVRVRGPSDFQWPSMEQLLVLVNKNVEGIIRIDLTDEHRTLLIAA